MHVRVCSPKIVHPCHLGIDFQSYSQLIGANRTEEQISEIIGADSVRYLPVDLLMKSCKTCKLDFCLGCFTGETPYPVNDFETDKLKLE